MRRYPVKENPIYSAVSEILRYKQIDILLLYYKDYLRNYIMVKWMYCSLFDNTLRFNFLLVYLLHLW